MANYYFGIKISLKLAITHQSIGNSLPMLSVLKEVSIERGVANYYFVIKITLKLAILHQPIGNSPSMLLELKEVNSKRSSKLLFWNKNNIKTC